jgi:hypothetical protein
MGRYSSYNDEGLLDHFSSHYTYLDCTGENEDGTISDEGSATYEEMYNRYVGEVVARSDETIFNYFTDGGKQGVLAVFYEPPVVIPVQTIITKGQAAAFRDALEAAEIQDED